MDETPNPVKEVEDAWVESGVVLGTDATQKDRLAWMAFKYSYNPKDIQEAPRGEQPRFGSRGFNDSSYRKKSGTRT